MRKNDLLSPKAIANKIKSKGLGKLKLYCELCHKQCRDENGFKCHCMSESHQRQMYLFERNPNGIVGGKSKEFEANFMELVKRSHRSSRVAATRVYNEYISDRDHVHMNATVWATLTDFVMYLGKTGRCKVDDTPKGWFITYIDRDPETLFKQKLKNKRDRSDLADEERQQREIKRQIARAEQVSEEVQLQERKLVDNLTENKRIKLSLGVKISRESSRAGVFADDDESDRERDNGESRGGNSALDELMREEEEAKERSNRKDGWLWEGTVVKVMSKVLAEKGYYKQKGVVKKVIDEFVGEIQMLESKHVLRVDQQELQTVIPRIGGLVKIVNGAYRGSDARLLAVDTDSFCAKVQIDKGIYDGRILKAVEYEDICKLA